MADQLEYISIGDRLDRPHEAEGARFRWADNSCELVISYSNLSPPELKGVQQGTFELGLNVVESMPFSLLSDL